MNKKKLNKVMLERYLLFKDIIINQNLMYGSPPNWKGNSPLMEHTQNLYDELEKIKPSLDIILKNKENISKDMGWNFYFCNELILYTQKMFNNGRYYSHTLLNSFGHNYKETKSLVQLTKLLKKHINIRIDTLLAFTIMRSRLEEMVLNLYFLYKSKNLIKDKKWGDLFILLQKTMHSGYSKDPNFKFKKKVRKKKKFLDYTITKNSKIHVSEVMKYVLKQKPLINDFDPFSFTSKEIEKNKKKLNKYQRYTLMKFHAQNKETNKVNSVSMKPINKYYDLLSDQLHPNNLFTRNVITSFKDGVELLFITRDHLLKLRDIDDYICDTNEILYTQTIKLIHYFVDRGKNQSKNKEFDLSFDQSVESKIIRINKLSKK
jgi:hypothetical protein